MSSVDIVQIFKKYNVEIYNYMLVRVGYNRERAQDLTQEVFEKFLINIDIYDEKKSSVRTWLYTIGRNLLIDDYRKNENNKMENLEEKYLDMEDEQSQLHNTEDELLMNVIKKKLILLNYKERELITLRYINQLGLDDITQIVKMDYKNLKVAVMRAVNKLKKLIEIT